MSKPNKQRKLETVNRILEDLGPGALDRLADGSWVWGDGLGGRTGAGLTPIAAILSAWGALSDEG